VGTFYPLLLASFLYSQVGLVNTSAGHSFDRLVQDWEHALFSTQPSMAWIRAWPWPWLSWILHLSYLAYYLLVPGPALLLWLTGRRAAARHTVLLVAATFYLCFGLFLLVPVAGPRYTFPLAVNAATGVGPAVWTQQLLNAGSAWGTAFPSSHVAVALVSSISGARASARIGLAFVPVAALLTLATVYGQFHYALDAAAGAALAAAVLLLGDRRSREDSGPSALLG
jgi:membrane-associated phospholipid phosphatase